MDDPVIEARGVVKDYGAKVVERVLHGVDIRVDRGDLVALIGPSGSGKSTLLNILGLLDAPTEGSVTILGTDTRGLGDRALTSLRGQALGFVFQFHHLIPSLRAWENVALPLAARDGYLRRSMRSRAVELLVRLGLGNKVEARVDELSGGQQQRVAIARALAVEPAVILADEPTGNVDTDTAARVFDVLEEVNREASTAILIVTHDARIAERCRRQIELVDGRIVRGESRRTAPEDADP